jgi:hypothetical protein
MSALAKLRAQLERAEAAPMSALPPPPPGVPPLWRVFGDESTKQCSWCGTQRKKDGTVRIPDPDLASNCPRCAILHPAEKVEPSASRASPSALLGKLGALVARARAALPPPAEQPPQVVQALPSRPPGSSPRRALARLPRQHSVTRREAGERIARVAESRGYQARVEAPADSQMIRVTLSAGERHPTYWVLLDGRLRTGGKKWEAPSAELEELANEALAGLHVMPVAPVPDFTVGGVEISQNDVGAFVLHDGRSTSYESVFTSRSEAERHARAIAGQYPEGPKRLVIPASAPSTTTATARELHVPDHRGKIEVRYDLAAAHVEGWYKGSPHVEVPFALFDAGDGTPILWEQDGTPLRGTLSVHEEVGDRYEPGHVSIFLRWEGGDARSLNFEPDQKNVHLRVLGPLVKLIPPEDVGFDGARVEVTAGEVRVRFDDEPDEEARSTLRKGKFKRAKDTTAWTWYREPVDGEAWWWARRAAWRVQEKREHRRRDELEIPSSREVTSHDAYRVRERMQRIQSALSSEETYARAHLLKHVWKLTPEGEAEMDRDVERLLRQRAELDELEALYGEGGRRRLSSERVAELPDMTAPFPSAFARVAHGIDMGERDGRIVVRLAAEQTDEFVNMNLDGYRRSRRKGEELWWAQPATQLGRYFAHRWAKNVAMRDAEERPTGFRHRFKGAVAEDEAWMPEPSPPDQAELPVFTLGISWLDKLLRLAKDGMDVAAWEAEAREALDRDDDEEPGVQFATVRGWLPVVDGRIADDTWLDAYRHALHTTDRRILIAARLYADQPLVAEAAQFARAGHGRDATLTLEQLAAGVLPATLKGIVRRRTANALLQAVAQLGLVEVEEDSARADRVYRDGVRVRTPPRVASAWGWLLHHQLDREGRAAMGRDEAVTTSLATRLLGYDEPTAAWALERAVGKGWIDVDGDALRPPAPASSGERRLGVGGAP